MKAKQLPIDKFTQEVKDAWLEALKSGKYVQGRVYLEKDSKHCCIGVLGNIHSELSNDAEIQNTIKCPYVYLDNTIGNLTGNLAILNDVTYNPNKPDYSNVIPFIEKLEVQS